MKECERKCRIAHPPNPKKWMNRNDAKIQILKGKNEWKLERNEVQINNSANGEKKRRAIKIEGMSE